MISSPLNDSPRMVAFIMGAVHGINAALLLPIAAERLRARRVQTGVGQLVERLMAE